LLIQRSGGNQVIYQPPEDKFYHEGFEFPSTIIMIFVGNPILCCPILSEKEFDNNTKASRKSVFHPEVPTTKNWHDPWQQNKVISLASHMNS
jgi:hypothetical protein